MADGFNSAQVPPVGLMQIDGVAVNLRAFDQLTDALRVHRLTNCVIDSTKIMQINLGIFKFNSPLKGDSIFRNVRLEYRRVALTFDEKQFDDRSAFISFQIGASRDRRANHCVAS